MFNNDIEYINISEDEEADDENIMRIGGRIPLRPIINDGGRSTESAALPTPPLPSPASGRPFSAPMTFSNLSVSPPSGNQSTDSASSMSLRYPFPLVPLTFNRQENGGTLSVSPLPSLTPPGPEAIAADEKASITHFMNRIQAGRSIQCLLCESNFPEHQLLKHICEEHFFGYRPFKCRECDFRTGDQDVLMTVHVLESGHERGVMNFEIIGERNKNVEFVIRMIFTHALYAHGNSEEGKGSILERMKDVTRVLRARRQNCFQDAVSAEADESEDDGVTAPVLSPVSPVVSDPPMVEEPVVSSSTSSVSPLLPIPITHRQARKTIVRPLPFPISPISSPSPSPSPRATSSMRPAEWNVMDQGNVSGGSRSETDGEDGRRSALFNSAAMPPALVNNGSCSTRSPPPVLEPEVARSASNPVQSFTPAPPLSPAIVSPTVSSPVVSAQLTCELCPCRCPNFASLKPHYQEFHTAGYFPYKCTQAGCNYGLWRERLVRMHVLDIHGVKTGKIIATTPTAEQKAQLELVIRSLAAKNVHVEEMTPYLKLGQ